ncbi:hypothetical protein [Desulforegula conservatrix]|uniref:hypothetical protein n=1 Tax=Desulforegula conservatrix TaxID=153026 RepID=UPI000684A07F|nr:hypothetical protein [Desulforegula conservatrix]
MKMLKSVKSLFVILIVGMFCSGYVFADEVTDSINEGLEHYKKGNHAEAVNSLNFASQKIAQLKAEKIKTLLPKPLDGWKAEEPSSQASGAAVFGGGVSAEGKYSKKDKGSVSVKFVTDSPMLQSMMMLFSNPMFATSDGGKLEKINNQKAIVKFDAANKSGNINIVVANKILVTVEGNDITQDDLMAYAKAVNYDQLAAMP